MQVEYSVWGGGGGGGGGVCDGDLRPEHNYNPPLHESQVLLLGVAALYKIKHNLQRDARPFACWLWVWSGFVLCLFTARCY